MFLQLALMCCPFFMIPWVQQYPLGPFIMVLGAMAMAEWTGRHKRACCTGESITPSCAAMLWKRSILGKGLGTTVAIVAELATYPAAEVVRLLWDSNKC